MKNHHSIGGSVLLVGVRGVIEFMPVNHSDILNPSSRWRHFLGEVGHEFKARAKLIRRKGVHVFFVKTEDHISADYSFALNISIFTCIAIPLAGFVAFHVGKLLCQ